MNNKIPLPLVSIISVTFKLQPLFSALLVLGELISRASYSPISAYQHVFGDLGGGCEVGIGGGADNICCLKSPTSAYHDVDFVDDFFRAFLSGSQSYINANYLIKYLSNTSYEMFHYHMILMRQDRKKGETASVKAKTAGKVLESVVFTGVVFCTW